MGMYLLLLRCHLPVLSHPLQRLCQSQATAEIAELLEGYKQCCIIKGVDLPEMVIVDNCCHVRSAIQQPFPDMSVVLDVYHLLAW